LGMRDRKKTASGGQIAKQDRMSHDGYQENGRKKRRIGNIGRV